MDNSINIPTEMYADEAVCFIANRYHITTQEAVQGFLVQSGITSNAKENETSDFRLEDNEMEIMKGLTDVYSSMKNVNTYNYGQKKFFEKVIGGGTAGGW